MNSKNTYSVITCKEQEVWAEYLKKSLSYDFYHTGHYHALEQSGEPFLFIFHSGENFVALPLIKRQIEGSGYFDCTSAYGYTGPVSNLEFDEIEESLIAGFHETLSRFFIAEKIVSVFSRLHPLLNHDNIVGHAGGVFKNGQTIAISLDKPVEKIRLNYRRAFRQKINQLRLTGFSVRESRHPDEINAFCRIYNESMKNAGASPRYFFNENYFFNFLSSRDYESKLLLCYQGETITSGIILTLCNKIAQIHLAATDPAFMSFSPMKLLFDEAVVTAKEENIEFLHLGSGVGGAEDSLFHFKCGFSDLRFNFLTWRYIADSNTYNNLVEQRQQNARELPDLFPLYRSA